MITNIYSFQWNCLPKTLVDSENVDAFKHDLKDTNSPPLWHWPYLLRGLAAFWVLKC